MLRPLLHFTVRHFIDSAHVQVVVFHADTLDGRRRDWRLVTGEKPCPTHKVDGGYLLCLLLYVFRLCVVCFLMRFAS
jgi:hypothetical protein